MKKLESPLEFHCPMAQTLGLLLKAKVQGLVGTFQKKFLMLPERRIEGA